MLKTAYEQGSEKTNRLSLIMNRKFKLFLMTLLLCSSGFGFALDVNAREGFTLKDEYLKISSVVFHEGKLIELFDTEEGTIEFWIKADWRDIPSAPIFAWGERAWRNSIMIFIDAQWKDLHSRISAYNWKGQAGFTERQSEMQLWENDSWQHIALEWGVDDETGEVIDMANCALFVNGRAVTGGDLHLHNRDKWGLTGTKLGGKLSASVPHFFLIGAVRANDGGIEDKLRPDFTISQFKISNQRKYKRNFTPRKKLQADANTLLFISTKDGKPLAEFYIDGKKTGNVRMEKLQFGE